MTLVHLDQPFLRNLGLEVTTLVVTQWVLIGVMVEKTIVKMVKNTRLSNQLSILKI